MNSRIRSYLAIVYLALCVMLGGASAAGAVANAILQGVAIVILLALIWSRRLVIPAEARPLAWIVGLFLVVALLTLVPVPMGVWQALPYRGQIAEGLGLIGVAPASLPISLAPAATIASLLWLLPPAALFLLAVNLPWEDRRRLFGTILALAALSITLGVFQLLGGAGSRLRFYEITNEASPVGFFANINHQATLILCAIPCAAVLATHFAGRSDRSKRSGGLIIAGAFALFLAAGIALSGSMAGYGLFVPTAFASFLVYRRAVAGAMSPRWTAALAVLLALFAGLALLGPVSYQTISSKYGAQPASRREIAAHSVEVIGQSFPIGTGLGTFAAVYRRGADPQVATNEFVNHSHNDYLETVLELGLPGLLLLVGFLIWWFRRARQAWKIDLRGSNVARAGSVIVGIVLLHSLVDFPVRTSAIAAIVAVACASLVAYVPPVRRRKSGQEDVEAEDVRHLEAA